MNIYLDQIMVIAITMLAMANTIALFLRIYLDVNPDKNYLEDSKVANIMQLFIWFLLMLFIASGSKILPI